MRSARRSACCLAIIALRVSLLLNAVTHAINPSHHRSLLFNSAAARTLASVYEEPNILQSSSRADRSGVDAWGDILRGDVQNDLTLIDNRFTAAQRMLLTSNCNTARVLSAYHNQVVSVTVLKNERVQLGLREREVVHSIGLKPCCVASTLVTATTPNAARLLDSKQSIADVFHSLQEIPTFCLIDVSSDNATFSRIFTLASSQIVCQVEEVFPANIFSPDFLKATQS